MGDHVIWFIKNCLHIPSFQRKRESNIFNQKKSQMFLQELPPTNMLIRGLEFESGECSFVFNT